MAKNNKWTCIAQKRFNDTIIITDPCYLNICGDEEEIKKKIGRCGLFSRTFCGDWGCAVYRCGRRAGYVDESNERLGNFCADSGQVCVVTLRDAGTFRPFIFDWLQEHAGCATVIHGFQGTVRFMTRERTVPSKYGSDYVVTELRVHGNGAVDGNDMSFESIQTSL